MLRPGFHCKSTEIDELAQKTLNIARKSFKKGKFRSNISRERSKRAIFYPKIKGDNSSLELCGSTTTNF